ncbi:class I SAM-dependent methyltransferase [Rummeliibacillus sp. NPDC094406]|uniref:class I SAM-dependent methyltransferase n=1 Tax=Rummeliibacillus sp. NPDC094406 TaxID=3364511 RepID=UPI0037F99675
MDYYGELCTKIYESEKSIAIGVELNFYLSFVKDNNMKVLEPMCGNGRMLIPFLQRGIDIEGFDISEEMLNVCEEKGKKLGLNPIVFLEKIEAFKSNKNYDLIMVPFGSFSLLPDKLVHVSLQNLKSVLNPDGKLLLTVMIKNTEVKEVPDWIETNRIQFVDQMIIEYKKMNYDQESKVLNIELKYQSVQGEQLVKIETMDFPIRLYELEEFKDLLQTNGFRDIVVHEVINGYGEGSSFNVFECEI